MHSVRKTAQLECSTNDMMHIVHNGGSVRDMHLLAYLTALSHHAFYSPRMLADHVHMRQISLPGVLVPRKQQPSKKRSDSKLKESLDERHSICHGKDKFLLNMLHSAVVDSE